MNIIEIILIVGGGLAGAMIALALILNWLERPDPPYDDEEEDSEYYFFHHKDRD